MKQPHTEAVRRDEGRRDRTTREAVDAPSSSGRTKARSLTRGPDDRGWVVHVDGELVATGGSVGRVEAGLRGWWSKGGWTDEQKILRPKHGWQMSTKEIVQKLRQASYPEPAVERNGNDTGYRIRIPRGPTVNVYDSGTVNVQGKPKAKAEVEEVLSGVIGSSGQTRGAPANRKVFVVYGHDTRARNDLEAMLRRWDLEPLILDQLPSEGRTIIEKLERYASDDVGYAVVLATPDDIGHKKEDPEDAKQRVRQNVVLELGLLLAKLGRDRVAILKPRIDDPFENPSDIDGLIYIPYVDSVDDAKTQLAKEMNRKGLTIDLDRL